MIFRQTMFAARALTCSGLRAVTRAGARRQLLPQLSFATSSVRPSSGDHVKMWTAERAVSLAQVKQYRNFAIHDEFPNLPRMSLRI